ncbi:hypothetical protein THUN1379_13530 [Paludibacterium sp. THUN1379]|uniref:HD-GYP domain-containing protein n=1 Tax=Paludibacterium sp. THUN1379 TaxID=3112107 RepID=UPI00308CD275|nr:hypothetical protein THUN1379_13530 [Paludibacterium sp. THUN1379]
MPTFRYLDDLLYPRQLALHRALLRRLLPVWLLLSLVAGLVVWQLESAQIDHLVLNLSADAVQQFRQSNGSDFWRLPAAQQQARLDQLLPRTAFVGMRLFDVRGQALAECWREPIGHASLPAAFPDDGQSRQQALRQGDRIYVQSLVPLHDARGQRQGWLQGIYRVPPQTAQAIAHRLRDTLIGVLLVIAISTLAIYPVILSLNRDALRLSQHLLSSNGELLRVLGSAIAQRDADTDSHNYRVTLYAVALAEALPLPPREIITLMTGAFLHDVGKIGIPDHILLKPGKLDAEEFSQMQQHVAIGLQIISEVDWLAQARDVVAGHHERYDGSGYPQGLRGEAIPLTARLFAIVDVFDALSVHRPYKAAFPLPQVLAMMQAERGSHFDPQLLDVFLALAPALHARYHQADTATLKRHISNVIQQYFRPHR